MGRLEAEGRAEAVVTQYLDTAGVPTICQKGKAVKPCDNCGKCCQEKTCGVAEKLGLSPDRPCGQLVDVDGRKLCGLLLKASYRERLRLASLLRIGVGCQHRNGEETNETE